MKRGHIPWAACSGVCHGQGSSSSYMYDPSGRALTAIIGVPGLVNGASFPIALSALSPPVLNV